MKFFFPVSRISFEVNFVLIEREGLIFLFKYALVKRPFFVTVHFAETLWTHLAVGGKYPGCQEQQSHSGQCSRHVCPAVPALDTQSQLLHCLGQQEGAGPWLGQRGCLPSFPAGGARAQHRLAGSRTGMSARDTATTAVLRSGTSLRSSLQPGLSIPPDRGGGQALSSKHSLAAGGRAAP